VVFKRSYKHFSQDQFINDLKLVPFWLVESTNDPNEALSMFNDLFMDIVNIHVPLKKFKIKAKPSPWLTDRIRELIKMRDAAKFEAKKSGFLSDWAVYRKLRNYVVKTNKESKKEYYLEAINKCKNDPKSMWKTINNLFGRKHQPIPRVESNGELLTNSKDIANHLAKHFEDKVSTFRQEMTDPIDRAYVCDSITKTRAGKSCDGSFEFKPLSLSEVRELLTHHPNSKSSGVDYIDIYLIKIASDIIAEPIKHIFNCSYATSTFPDRWKVAKLCPIPKDKKVPFDDANSRPISLLNVLSKLFERSAFQQMNRFFSVNEVMVLDQHAYREHHSTESALIQLSDNCLRNMENGLLTGVVLLDFSAAFDLVDHDLLLLKLKCYHFSDSAIDWIKSYLSGRSSMVYVNGEFSHPISSLCGVPQGSCLGPLLFSVFINDFQLYFLVQK
jgi:hypothetical protein